MTDKHNAMMMYAINKLGDFAYIGEVESGLKCSCFCVDCGSPVMAKKGNILTHHFAHVADDKAIEMGFTPTACNWQPETDLHLMAKEVIRKDGYINAPRSNLSNRRKKIVFDRVDIEKRQGAIIPDLTGWCNGEAVYIEIVVTHACEPKKIEYLRENYTCIEIYIDRDFKSNDISCYEAIEKLLHSNAKMKWLSVAACGDISEMIYKESQSIFKEINEASYYTETARDYDLFISGREKEYLDSIKNKEDGIDNAFQQIDKATRALHKKADNIYKRERVANAKMIELKLWCVDDYKMTIDKLIELVYQPDRYSSGDIDICNRLSAMKNRRVKSLPGWEKKFLWSLIKKHINVIYGNGKTDLIKVPEQEENHCLFSKVMKKQ